ncbi:hypothetical protein ECG_01753 [Echinococcus granulosus]|nr:hypothetical protein ECG_01753 [Echinococcus granulosus]
MICSYHLHNGNPIKILPFSNYEYVFSKCGRASTWLKFHWLEGATKTALDGAVDGRWHHMAREIPSVCALTERELKISNLCQCHLYSLQVVNNFLWDQHNSFEHISEWK